MIDPESTEREQTRYVPTVTHMMVDGNWLTRAEVRDQFGITPEQLRFRKETGKAALSDEEHMLETFFDDEWRDVPFGD